MQKINNSRYLIILITALIFISGFFLQSCTAPNRRTIEQWEKIEQQRIDASQQDVQYKGKVLEIIADEEEILEGNFISRKQVLKVRATSGPFKGEIIEVKNIFDSTSAYGLVIRKNQGIFFIPEINKEGIIENAYVSEIVRDNYLLIITILFIIILILIGRFKGLRASISIALTAAAVFFILIPLLLRGYNPVLISVLTGIGITFLTLLIISGANRKSLAAIIGTSTGIIAGGILALIFGSLSNLTGLSNDEAIMLMYIPQNIDFDFRGILFAGIILASLGAVMDVSMSISSAMLEVVKADPTIKKNSFIYSGMNIGKDIISTMSNTLILVYIGSSIPLIMLFMAYNIGFIDIINKDIIASEIIRALSGSIGLILAIPITVFVSAGLYDLNYVRSIRNRNI